MTGFVMNRLPEGSPLHSAAVAFSTATEEELARLPPCNSPDDKRFNYRKNVPQLSKTFYSVLENFSGWPSSCPSKDTQPVEAFVADDGSMMKDTPVEILQKLGLDVEQPPEKKRRLEAAVLEEPVQPSVEAAVEQAVDAPVQAIVEIPV